MFQPSKHIQLKIKKIDRFQENLKNSNIKPILKRLNVTGHYIVRNQVRYRFI